jgi:hypothetical protein
MKKKAAPGLPFFVHSLLRNVAATEQQGTE